MYGKERRKKDRLQTKKLRQAGYSVYRFWEHDINKSASKCINSIVELSHSANTAII